MPEKEMSSITQTRLQGAQTENIVLMCLSINLCRISFFEWESDLDFWARVYYSKKGFVTTLSICLQTNPTCFSKPNWKKEQTWKRKMPWKRENYRQNILMWKKIYFHSCLSRFRAFSSIFIFMTGSFGMMRGKAPSITLNKH